MENLKESYPLMNEGEAYMAVDDRMAIFATGTGVIEPTDEYTNEEVLRASDEAQKPVEDPHVVCMDERESVEGLQPVREKVAGGNETTGLFMAAGADWSGLTDEQRQTGPEAIAEEVAIFLVDNGESLGAHRQNIIHGENKTGCGAVDKSPETLVNTKEHALDEVVVEQAKIDLGEFYNHGVWERVHARFSAIADNPDWQTWRTSRIQEIVEEHGGVVETLDAEKDAYKDLSGARHGHWGEAARINSREGFSNDRDNARVPTFQIDLAPIIRIAKKMANTQEEFVELLHAGAMFQYMTTYTLTKNMRIIR